jgi:hypothetical protein
MNRIGFVGVLLMTLALSSVTHAEIIDQEQTSANAAGTGYLTQSLAPVGQVFTPTYGGIDFFRFFLDNTSTTDIVLSLSIYDVATHAQVGTTVSATAYADGGVHAATPVEFDFASVPLTAGDQYAATFGALPSGNVLIGYGTSVTGTYTGGYAFVGETPTGYQTMFQEGISVPEPTAACLSAIGLICVWGGHQIRRRRRKLGA